MRAPLMESPVNLLKILRTVPCPRPMQDGEACGSYLLGVDANTLSCGQCGCTYSLAYEVVGLAGDDEAFEMKWIIRKS